MSYQVSVVKKTDSADRAVRQAMELLGGMSAFVKPGQSVLLKPNFTGPLSSDDGAVTSAPVLESIIAQVREAGASKVDIVEGSGAFHLGTKKIYDILGVTELAQRCGVGLYDANELEFRRVKSPDFCFLEYVDVCEAAWQYDVIINIPVIKTHPLTEITVAYKNMNGLLSPVDKRRFHDLNMRKAVVDLTTALPSYLTIVDGITAMEGLGPLEGTPVDLGLIVAGGNPLAVDATVARIIGFQPEKIDYIRYAAEAGHGSWHEEDIQVLGTPIQEVYRPFKTAEPQSRHYDGVEIFEQEMPRKCYGCRAVLTIAMTRIRECGHLPGFKGMKVLLNGSNPEDMPERGEGEHLFCLGNCTKEYYDAHKDEPGIHFILGCAPSGLTTEESFREVYGIPRPSEHVKGHVEE